MKYTLLLRLKAPMQSWGESSRFSIRDSGREPTKSGVIGLLCAARGISRQNANLENRDFERLAGLTMGVRVLKEGSLKKDFHTAQNIAKADGKGKKDTEISTRWYLSDADFLVGLEGEDPDHLALIQNSLMNPKWHLFLGRKAFVPSMPVHMANSNEGIKEGNVADVLKAFRVDSRVTRQRLLVEDKLGNEVRRDVPVDFAKRKFSVRRVRTEYFETSFGGHNDE